MEVEFLVTRNICSVVDSLWYFLKILSFNSMLWVCMARFLVAGGGAIGVASVRSCEKLPPRLIKPVPAGSKTYAPLPKAKPISDSGSASDNIFKKGKKMAVREKSETM